MKVKIVESLWGTEFLILPRLIWKNRMNSSYSSKLIEAKQLTKQRIEQILSPKQTRRPLPSLSVPFFLLCGKISGSKSCDWSSSPGLPQPKELYCILFEFYTATDYELLYFCIHFCTKRIIF